MAPIPRHSRDRCGVPHSHLGGLTYVWVRSACFLGNRRTVKPCVCCQHFKKLHLIEYDLRPVKAAHVNHTYLSSRKPPLAGTAKCLKFRPAHELVLPRFDSWVGDEAQFITHGRSAGGSVRMSTPPWAPIPSGGGEGLVAPRAPRAVLRERGLGGTVTTLPLLQGSPRPCFPGLLATQTALRRRAGAKASTSLGGLCPKAQEVHGGSLIPTRRTSGISTFSSPQTFRRALSPLAPPPRAPPCGPVAAAL